MQYGSMQDRIISVIEATTQSHERHDFWRRPLVRCMAADDPSLASLRESVCADHLMPEDILPGARSVVSFFIPFDETIPKSNTTGDFASAVWAECYILTNALIARISDDVESLMTAHGYRTGKIPATHNFDKVRIISRWSHRHIAFLAGLGTFGLNNMLITESGCCGRFGTIITDCPVETGEKQSVAEKCLYKASGTCGVCVRKCNTGALRVDGFDRHRCYEECQSNAAFHESLGKADVCGKCTVGLPCSLSDPTAS